ncbi:MAG TPA: FecR domain-containing protein, partial [Polyangiaceae bacterium]|nr:FecR domain-containing protein [Polyangiaceae bacterium]
MRPSPSRRPVSSPPSFAAPAASAASPASAAFAASPASAASAASPAFVASAASPASAASAASPALARYVRALAAGLVALSLGPAAAAAPKPAAAPAEATTASVTRGRGCVREAPGQACRDASVDLTTVPQGAFVAGAEGATLRLNDGSLLELDPEAEVRFLATQSVQVPARVKAPVVQLLLGRARCTVAATPPPKAVMVRGPSASVAVVSGGTAAFRAWPDKLAVGVRSGKAITSAGENDWV